MCICWSKLWKSMIENFEEITKINFKYIKTINNKIVNQQIESQNFLYENWNVKPTICV